MKKRISFVVLICFIFSLLSSELLVALEMQTQPKKIAVLNLVALDEMEQEESNLFTRRLIRELNDDPLYEGLPQNEIANLLEGSGINPSSCTSLECGLQAGQVLNVPFVVIGNLSKNGNLFTVNVRMVDIQNQKIVNSVHNEFRGNEINFLTFLSALAAKLTNTPEMMDTQMPVADPIIQQILDQSNKNIEEAEQPPTANIPQENRQVPMQNQTIAQKSGSKWKLFGLLVLAGAGAAVYFFKTQDDDDKQTTTDDQVITTPLPTPPSFPKK